ncbi:amino acid ABC transporter ATP-binding protein [Roseomonas sp. E05]|uniref:amino acid ABC transporter ATP-binding protein n=1 Tax=Roseomonas sp. E05 TaxID=3046310 RepID=UPI0024BBD0AB|nr:amino acid ABC transporter ATP-binding protein [Roseomonas sp. E05]MDJ0391048.1 amino acid ABC transporter ATP-binding protein [Roseomonas sp. E05]
MDVPAKPLLTIRGLEKSFGPLKVLKGIDLAVRRGEVVGLIGASGSGKSTLLRCINLLEAPSAGEIRLDGQRVGFREDGSRRLRDAEVSAQRRRMAMVFQQFNLWPHKTALENVVEAPVVMNRLGREAARALGLRMLEKVGMTAKADTYPSRLSGGQQQRVGIARALALEPDLLLFDEPTSALDPELVDEVLRVMKALASEGTTMIVVTHEMGFAHEVCDQVVLLADGEIVDQGSARHIFETTGNPRTRAFLERYRRSGQAQAAADAGGNVA